MSDMVSFPRVHRTAISCEKGIGLSMWVSMICYDRDLLVKCCIDWANLFVWPVGGWPSWLIEIKGKCDIY